MPPVGFGVQGGLKYFNLKYRLCGHLDTISFLEFSMSFGLESAMCVFSERHVSQNFAPTLYGTALDFKDHFMSSILIFSPKSICFQTKLESLVPFWFLCFIFPLCSFHLSMKGRLVMPTYDFTECFVLTVASYTTLSVLHFPLTGHTIFCFMHLQSCSGELFCFCLSFLKLLAAIWDFRFCIAQWLGSKASIKKLSPEWDCIYLQSYPLVI